MRLGDNRDHLAEVLVTLGVSRSLTVRLRDFWSVSSVDPRLYLTDAVVDTRKRITGMMQTAFRVTGAFDLGKQSQGGGSAEEEGCSEKARLHQH